MPSNLTYEHQRQILDELLKEASSPSGAILLIPDLQRPYVWDPSRVVLLMDSLIRGWPFGTLLLWCVPDEEKDSIPSRTFWSSVDRVESEQGTPAGKERGKPAAYRMVLDGQQRLQSLLLAIGGDNYGFKLLDRDWFASLEGSRPHGRNTGHWTSGQLFLDREAFLKGYRAGKGFVEDVEYRDALVWCARAEGDLSTGKLPHNYQRPLPCAWRARSRYIRLFRLWEIASPNSTLPKVYREPVRKELQLHGVPEDEIAASLEPLCELVSKLGQVKAVPVSALQLNRYSGASMDERDVYNSAIVNIFTRLNSAGRVLTNPEIIFAWIKRNWCLGDTRGRDAVTCFAELRGELAQHGLELDDDELVRGMAALWSVLFNQGKVLTPKELLRGAVVQEMAPALAVRWEALAKSATQCQSLMQRLELVYRTHYESLNSVFVLWAWRYLAVEWLRTRGSGLKVMERDWYQKELDARFENRAERWLLLSLWSGTWRGRSTTAFDGYLHMLSKLWGTLEAEGDFRKVLDHLSGLLDTWLEALQRPAERYIDDLVVDSRKEVHRYWVPLWVWHRLDHSREEQSRVQIRKGKQKTSLHVDHIVSCGWWEKNVGPLSEEVSPAGEEGQGEEVAQGALNDIGNCSLLWSSFNIAKSDQTLRWFVFKVHELGTEERRQTWREALKVGEHQFEPDPAKTVELRREIAGRTRAIKDDLKAFIRGAQAIRQEQPPRDFSGTWRMHMDVEFPCHLTQSGDHIRGTYEGGWIVGTLSGLDFRGRWQEGSLKGELQCRFSEDGKSLSGDWRKSRQRRPAQPWQGTRERE